MVLLLVQDVVINMRICGKCFDNSLFVKFGRTSSKLKRYFNLDDLCVSCTTTLQNTMEEEIAEKKKQTGRRLSSKQYINNLSVGKRGDTINY
jgi:MinD superfamily P-loop ATPase